MAYAEKHHNVQGQTLDLNVVGCANLSDKEWFSRQDPYVIIEYSGQKYRTRTDTDGGRNPSFNETFKISLIEGLREVQAHVWNSNTLERDDYIGSTKIWLNKVIDSGYDDTQWPLTNSRTLKSAGTLKLILHYGGSGKNLVTRLGSNPVVFARIDAFSLVFASSTSGSLECRMKLRVCIFNRSQTNGNYDCLTLLSSAYAQKPAKCEQTAHPPAPHGVYTQPGPSYGYPTPPYGVPGHQPHTAYPPAGYCAPPPPPSAGPQTFIPVYSAPPPVPYPRPQPQPVAYVATPPAQPPYYHPASAPVHPGAPAYHNPGYQNPAYQNPGYPPSGYPPYNPY
uniref:C2 domain-containing protein n=1 Tax=Physcomitrium patens TaxID=3218 RepID=A0A7I4ENP6_PHYPA